MRSSTRSTVGRALIVGGALAFACWGYFWSEQLLFQRAAIHVLAKQMVPGRGLINHPAEVRNRIASPRSGEVLGLLKIPRLRLSVIILEGVDSDILRRGAGHISGTALPGTLGNVGIAGHRDTLFRPLRDIRANDVIVLETPKGSFRYRVERTEVVEPTDVQVLHHTDDAELTLVTCYPFYFLGPAPKRFIIHARQT
jgi:LPXTG-site transpeptidase (sortase) family protein